MKANINSILEWFDLSKYKELIASASDEGLCYFLISRAELYQDLSLSSDFDTPYLFKGQTITREQYYSLRFRKTVSEILDFQPKAYVSEQYSQLRESEFVTPSWLEEINYKCNAVCPISVSEMVGACDFLNSNEHLNFEPEGKIKDQRKEAISNWWRDDSMKHDTPTLPIDSFSYDDLLLRLNREHDGAVSLKIDLKAGDTQILNELEKLLPLLREGLRHKHLSDIPPKKEQAFLPRTKVGKRKKALSLHKVRAYRVPAIIDLIIWLKLKNLELSESSTMNLVFDGRGELEPDLTYDNFRKVHLPYAYECMNLNLLNELKYRHTHV